MKSFHHSLGLFPCSQSLEPSPTFCLSWSYVSNVSPSLLSSWGRVTCCSVWIGCCASEMSWKFPQCSRDLSAETQASLITHLFMLTTRLLPCTGQSLQPWSFFPQHTFQNQFNSYSCIHCLSRPRTYQQRDLSMPCAVSRGWGMQVPSTTL